MSRVPVLHTMGYSKSFCTNDEGVKNSTQYLLPLIFQEHKPLNTKNRLT